MGSTQITKPVFHYSCDWPLCKKEEFTDQAVVSYGGPLGHFYEVVIGPRYSYTSNKGPQRVLLLCEEHFYSWFDRPDPEPEARKK